MFVWNNVLEKAIGIEMSIMGRAASRGPDLRGEKVPH
jgi:hypothetical protein